MDQDTNVNVAKRVVEKNQWGYDTMVNFCTGKSVDVPWTIADYVGALFVIGVLLAGVAILVAMLWSIATDR